MATKREYLLDIREHPGATAEEIFSRVQPVSLAAVETFFRKAASAKLVALDESQPKRRFTLTALGEQALSNLAFENGDHPHDGIGALVAQPNGQSREARLEERAKRLGSGIDSPRKAVRVMNYGSQTPPDDIRALYQARHKCHSFSWQERLFNDDAEARRSVAELQARLPKEITQQVAKLVELERKLQEDSWSRNFWRDLHRLLELREGLTFSSNLCGLRKGDESEEEADSGNSED